MKNNSCQNVIKKLDFFGKKVELNFDKNGPTHRTYFGGIITIFYVLFIMAYSIYGFLNVQNHTKDKIIVTKNFINMEELGRINFNETGMLIYSLISGSQVNDKLDDLSRYLDVYFQVCYRDINKASSCVSTIRVEAKWCE